MAYGGGQVVPGTSSWGRERKWNPAGMHNVAVRLRVEVVEVKEKRVMPVIIMAMKQVRREKKSRQSVWVSKKMRRLQKNV
jgi:hypothetical protein